MIRFLPENKKLGHIMPEKKAMEQGVAMAMPETIMPVDTKPGKIIELQGQRMLKKKCDRQGTGRQEPRNRKDMKKEIPRWNESEPTGTPWGNAWGKDACQAGMRGTGWTECIFPR
jgi:flavoprotein